MALQDVNNGRLYAVVHSQKSSTTMKKVSRFLFGLSVFGENRHETDRCCWHRSLILMSIMWVSLCRIVNSCTIYISHVADFHDDNEFRRRRHNTEPIRSLERRDSNNRAHSEMAIIIFAKCCIDTVMMIIGELVYLCVCVCCCW